MHNRPPLRRRLRLAISCLLLGTVLWQWGQAGWILAKAELAQVLIARAWQQQLASGVASPPWPWADTWPVARLRFSSSGKSLYVLAGADGSALAFGPGHLAGTAPPGRGASVVGGHRDTHFSTLENVVIGARFDVQDQQGGWHLYEVVSRQVVDSRHQPLRIDSHSQSLTLVTCFPFHSVSPGGPLRLVVIAEPRTATDAD